MKAKPNKQINRLKGGKQKHNRRTEHIEIGVENEVELDVEVEKQE